MSPVRTQDPDRIPWWDQRTIPRSRPPPAERRARYYPGCRFYSTGAATARPGRDRARRYLVQFGPPAPSETARPNGVLAVIPGDGKKSSRSELVTVTVMQCGGQVRCRPTGQQRSCCDDHLSPANTSRSSSVRPSMGSVGDAYDTAMRESFFATLLWGRGRVKRRLLPATTQRSVIATRRIRGTIQTRSGLRHVIAHCRYGTAFSHGFV
jgi:hypothetical protein